LLWEKFMANPEIQPMLDSIGFVSDSVTNINDDLNTVYDFLLIGNYPNPFNPSTTIVFNIPFAQYVSISIYNHLGEKIKDLTNKEFPFGENKIVWNGLNNDGSPVSSGIYLYKLISESKSLFGKMILQK